MNVLNYNPAFHKLSFRGVLFLEVISWYHWYSRCALFEFRISINNLNISWNIYNKYEEPWTHKKNPTIVFNSSGYHYLQEISRIKISLLLNPHKWKLSLWSVCISLTDLRRIASDFSLNGHLTLDPALSFCAIFSSFFSS